MLVGIVLLLDVVVGVVGVVGVVVCVRFSGLLFVWVGVVVIGVCVI